METQASPLSIDSIDEADSKVLAAWYASTPMATNLEGAAGKLKKPSKEALKDVLKAFFFGRETASPETLARMLSSSVDMWKVSAITGLGGEVLISWVKAFCVFFGF